VGGIVVLFDGVRRGLGWVRGAAWGHAEGRH
jgi:hypothetical protein